ncbi:MAG: hypothetical protein LBU03_02405 [Tannerellaceae bacterium]|nr:hypothetical protein [Tannerellaceae bacterium]
METAEIVFYVIYGLLCIGFGVVFRRLFRKKGGRMVRGKEVIGGER